MTRLQTDGWFHSYRGFIYANTPTDIHARINNKANIDRQLNEKGTVTTFAGEIAPIN